MLRFLIDRKGKMKNIKSQSAMEFLILIGLAFLATILFVTISVNEIKEFKSQKDFFLIKDLALKLQKEVSIAATVEDGYERNFDLPNKLESTDYFITTKNTSITVNSSGTVFSVTIPIIIGNFTKGNNKIEKISGKVYINR